MRLFTAVLFFTVCSSSLGNKHKKSYDGDFSFEEDDWKQKKHAVKTWIWDPENGLCAPLQCRKSEICLLEDSFTAVCVSRPEIKKNGDRIISRELAEDEHLIKPDAWATDSVDIEADDEEDEDYQIDLDEEDDDDDEYDEYYDEDDDDELNEVTAETKTLTTPAPVKRVCKECPYTHPTVSSYICGTDNRTYSSLCKLEQHNCVYQTAVTTDCKGFCPCRVPGSYRRRKDKQRERLNRAEESWHKKHKSQQKDKYERFSKKKSLNNIRYHTPQSNAVQTNECTSSELQEMGPRLLDWFSVLKSTGSLKINPKHRRYHRAHFPAGCEQRVQWMFRHLDADADAQLTLRELYRIENDQHEHCLKPFLDRCDLDGDIFLSTREWCRCFARPASHRPCDSVRDQTQGLLGAFVPKCDGEGYYSPTQCQASTGYCWCTDKHGTELVGTRTRGVPNCDGSAPRFSSAVDDDEDNYLIEGSADALLEF